MLILESSPNQYTPNPLGQAANWVINNPDIRTVLPQPNTYILRFNSAGGNGQNFTIGGVVFTADDATAYTSTTFDHSQQAFLSAINAKNAILSNPAFRNYTVRTARPSNGQPWRVIAVKITRDDASAEELDIADNNIVGVTVEIIAGRSEVRQRQRLWYQLWSNNGPVSEEKFAPFDDSGRATIDGSEIARRILGYMAPDPEQQMILLDFNASQFMSLKYGTYTSDGDCSSVFGQVFESPACPFINAVRQHTDVEGMQPYGPLRQPGNLLQWLSSRSTNRTLPKDGYDWTAIYLGPDPFFGSSDWRIRREFFDESGSSLGVMLDEISGVGVWRIATGGNGVPAQIGTVSYYTVQVQSPLGFSFLPSSEELRVNLKNHSCQEAEVYYLEGLGSWSVMGFERKEQEGISMLSQEWNQPQFDVIDPGAVLSEGGGRSQRVTESRDVFTLTTEPISANKRRLVKEMLESPAAYILVKDETGREVTRRLNFDRDSYSVATRGEIARVSVTFTYAQNRRSR